MTEPKPKDPPSLIRRAGLLAGPAMLALVLLIEPPWGLADPAWLVMGVGLWMVIWWMTEPVPLAVTALLPVALLPLLEVGDLDAVAARYAHPLIFLFLGGFIIAKALERWGLHRRIAVAVLRAGPATPAGLVGAMMVATAFLSMWISNTATAMVMAPIAQSIIAALTGDTPNHERSRTDSAFAAALLLGIAFAATIGGMGTLIGTPPNALLAGYAARDLGIAIGFGQWMLLGLPVVIVLLPLTWLLLTHLLLAPADPALPHRRLELDALIGPLRGEEERLSPGARLTAWIAVATGVLLIVRPLIEQGVPELSLSDAGIAVTAAILLFALPVPGEPGQRLLTWQQAAALRWDVLILFGGGLALAGAIGSSGLAEAIGQAISASAALPTALLVLITMAVMVYLGELASNTAMAAVFLPVAGAAALGLGLDPLTLVLPVGLAASLGFMLPVATPPNAIVYGTGDVESAQMLRVGAVLDVVSILVVFGLATVLGPLVFTSAG